MLEEMLRRYIRRNGKRKRRKRSGKIPRRRRRKRKRRSEEERRSGQTPRRRRRARRGSGAQIEGREPRGPQGRAASPEAGPDRGSLRRRARGGEGAAVTLLPTFAPTWHSSAWTKLELQNAHCFPI